MVGALAASARAATQCLEQGHVVVQLALAHARQRQLCIAPGLLRFDNYTLLIQAALAGQGVAIGWRHLVDDLLEQGLLCPLLKERVRSSYGYYLVLPERKRRQRLTQRFVDWLQAELAEENATSPGAV